MGTFITYFLRAWVGSSEYHEARHQPSQTWSFPLRFWGRLLIAVLGLCIFLWQQLAAPPNWSETFVTLLLGLTASQAAGPLCYLLFKCTMQFFLTPDYRAALGKGEWYFTRKSALSLLLMTMLSVLAASGVLGTRWYVKPVVFLLTVLVAWFFVFIPALNWAGVHWIGFPKAILTKGKQQPATQKRTTASLEAKTDTRRARPLPASPAGTCLRANKNRLA